MKSWIKFIKHVVKEKWNKASTPKKVLAGCGVSIAAFVGIVIVGFVGLMTIAINSDYDYDYTPPEYIPEKHQTTQTKAPTSIYSIPSGAEAEKFMRDRQNLYNSDQRNQQVPQWQPSQQSDRERESAFDKLMEEVEKEVFKMTIEEAEKYYDKKYKNSRSFTPPQKTAIWKRMRKIVLRR